MRGRSDLILILPPQLQKYNPRQREKTYTPLDHEHARGGTAGIQTTEPHTYQKKFTRDIKNLHEQGYPARSACSHVGDVDDSLVAEARGSEIHGLLLAELEVLAAALARQEGGEHVLRDADPFVLQVQPI